jgi:lycopene cyclase domain-containing protein
VSYTELAVVFFMLAGIFDIVVTQSRMLARHDFWLSYAIILFFQLLTNAWLTSREIVTYEMNAIWGPRLAFAPLEDILFGFALVLSVLSLWDLLGRRAALRAKTPAPQ